MHRLDQIFDREGIFADDEALDLLERGDHRLGAPFKRPLADAVDPRIGIEFDEDEVGARGVDDGPGRT